MRKVLKHRNAIKQGILFFAGIMLVLYFSQEILKIGNQGLFAFNEQHTLKEEEKDLLTVLTESLENIVERLILLVVVKRRLYKSPTLRGVNYWNNYIIS